MIVGIAGVAAILAIIWFYRDPRNSAEVKKITKEHPSGHPKEVVTK